METLRHMAAELGPSGVTAVGVLPGFIDTDSIRMMTGPLYEALKRAEIETHPLREAASPELAAEAIALLCLPEARWLNGQVVHNDGGGLFAMQGRFFHAAIQAAGLSPGDDSPVVGV
jgi:NAD(P)-dependent dehydrogenase (short-subunit alcohol dehydrogenase family)